MHALPKPLALIVLCLVVALGPVISWQHHFSHDTVRLLQLLGGLAVASALIVASLRGSWRPLPSPGPAAIGLLLLGALSVASAAQPELALREFCLWLLAALAVWPREASGAASSGATWQIAGPLLIAGATLYAALELLLIASGLLLDHTLDYWRVFAGYVNPRFFNHVQTLLIPLLAGVIGLSEPRPLWRRLAWFALAANAFFLLMLMGRATGLALVVSSAAVLLLFGNAARDYVVRLLLGFAAGALLYLLLIKLLPALIGMEALPAFRELGERNSIEARFYLWRIALDMIQAHPLLGVGAMHYADQFNGEAAHPHNIYLQVAAEFGLPFFFLLAFLVLRWLARTARCLRMHLRQSGDPLALACYAAVLGALVDGGFSGNFVMPLPQLWIVITLMLLNARLPSQTASTPAQPSAMRITLYRAALAALFAAQLFVVLQSVPEVIKTPVRLEGAPEHPDATHYSPRFWSDGWF